jgi:hypothetical protein
LRVNHVSHDEVKRQSLWFPIKIDRLLLAVSLFFLALTLFLAGLSFQMTDFGLRFETRLYASCIFISGIAILVLIEIIIWQNGRFRGITAPEASA